MRDVNKWLEEALRELKLPCSEEPMRESACPEGYITWKMVREKLLYASGKPWQRQVTADVSLWLPGDADWQDVYGRAQWLLMQEGAWSMILKSADWLGDLQLRRVVLRVQLPPEVAA